MLPEIGQKEDPTNMINIMDENISSMGTSEALAKKVEELERLREIDA